MKKRIISLLLALIMALSLLPVSVLAADDHTGQVHVTVENTTWAEADGAPWEGMLVDEWVTLQDDSSMMSCIVDALTAGGYSQTGADTGYISEINGIEEKAAAEGSGWQRLVHQRGLRRLHRGQWQAEGRGRDRRAAHLQSGCGHRRCFWG